MSWVVWKLGRKQKKQHQLSHLLLYRCNLSEALDLFQSMFFILLHAGVEGPCLHRPENWLMRQLNDEPKLVYKVGFIREEGKATAREVQQSPEAGGWLLGEGWGFYGCSNSELGVFLIGHGFVGFLR
jgi:hypothetical protein